MVNDENPVTFDQTHPKPPFDHELEPVVSLVCSALPRFSDGTLHAIREIMAGGLPGKEPADLTAGGAVMVEEHQIQRPPPLPGLTVLVLRPATTDRTLACIYHTHGGGMVVGTHRSGVDEYVRYVAEGLAVVVSVDYRLAPEHPDPAPITDCYDGLVWSAKNSETLGIDPHRILIAGTSAGGGLAAGTALMARDRGFPHLTHQILVCPMLDDRMQTQSSAMLDGDGIWDRNDNAYGWTSLLGSRRGGPDVSPYAAPARAEDLSGLPQTYIDVGSAETFRDEALDYAARLSAAGTLVDLHMWGGGFHGFDLMASHAAISVASRATREEFIRRAIKS